MLDGLHIGINGDIAFAEQGEQRPVVGFEVRHNLDEWRDMILPIFQTTT